MDVLEVIPPDHQPRWLGRPANRAIEPAKRFVKARPRHQCRQARIDDGIEGWRNKSLLPDDGRAGSIAKTPENDGIKGGFRHSAILQT